MIPLAPRALPPSPRFARRQEKQDWPDYLLHAVVCGDSIDDQTTTKEVFDEIVRVVKDVSPMCRRLHRLEIIDVADGTEQLAKSFFRVSTIATNGRFVQSNDSRVLLTLHPSVAKSS